MRGIKTLSRPFRFHQENVPTSPNPQFCQIGRHNYTQNWPISFWSQDIKRISQMFPSRTWENNIWLKWRNISLRNSENVRREGADIERWLHLHWIYSKVTVNSAPNTLEEEEKTWFHGILLWLVHTMQCCLLTTGQMTKSIWGVWSWS